MNKIRLNRYISFALGMTLLSLGVVLALKANYGVTVATSPSYVLSLCFPQVSFGTFNYLAQGAVFLLMVATLRRFQISYFLSFLASVLVGFGIDFFNGLLADLTLLSSISRISCFALSILIIATGLVFFIRSRLPILPFDMFVREVSAKYGTTISRFKTVFDLVLLSIATALSMAYLGALEGIGIGTLVSALTIGPSIGIIMKRFDQVFTVPDPQ